jgi:hypothetical protein
MLAVLAPAHLAEGGCMSASELETHVVDLLAQGWQPWEIAQTLGLDRGRIEALVERLTADQGENQNQGARVSRPLAGTAAKVAAAAIEAAPTVRGPQRSASPPDPGSPDLLAGLRNGAWLDRQEFPPLTYAVPALIPEGLVLMVGAPKIGKSWKVLAHALAVSAGGVTLGTLKVGPARPVLYLALEDGDRRLQDRCRRLLESEPIPERLDYLTRVHHGQVIATITAWLDRRHGEQPLVILDTLGKVMPPALPGESSYQRDYRIGSTLHHLYDEHPGTHAADHPPRPQSRRRRLHRLGKRHPRPRRRGRRDPRARPRPRRADRAPQGDRPRHPRRRVRAAVRGRVPLAARRRRPRSCRPPRPRPAGDRRTRRPLR